MGDAIGVINAWGVPILEKFTVCGSGCGCKEIRMFQFWKLSHGVRQCFRAAQNESDETQYVMGG
jgi:hypothetical protein